MLPHRAACLFRRDVPGAARLAREPWRGRRARARARPRAHEGMRDVPVTCGRDRTTLRVVKPRSAERAAPRGWQPHRRKPEGLRRVHPKPAILLETHRGPILPAMLENLLKSVFGSKHEREVRRARPLVDEINRLFAEFEGLSDDALRGKTGEFRARLERGEDT